MKVKSVFSKVKRGMSILLAVLILLTSFSFGSVKVNAESGELIPIFLKLKAGTRMSTMENLESLSNDDMRMISLFLSNFYLPWATTLDSEESITNNQEMAEVLQNLGFDRDAAVSLSEMAYESTLSTATKLYVALDAAPNGYRLGSNGYDSSKSLDPGIDEDSFTGNDLYKSLVGNPVTGSNGKEYTPVTLYMFYCMIDMVARSNGEDRFDMYILGEDGALNTTNSSGNSTAAFTIDHDFVKSYYSVLSRMDDSNGLLGNALFNGVSTSKENQDPVNMSNSELGSLLSFTQNMYVDWVGNVIVDMGDRRVVAVPAVMNLNTFVTITNPDRHVDMFSSAFGFNAYNVDDLFNNVTNNRMVGGLLLDYVQDRGSTAQVGWDTKLPSIGSKDDGYKKIKSFCKELGIHLGGNDKWEFRYINLGSYIKKSGLNYVRDTSHSVLSKSNEAVRFSYLVTSDNIGEGYEYTIGDTTLIVYDYFDADLKGKYFTSTGKFSSTSKEFGSIMTIDTDDYRILSDIFTTYLILYNNYTFPSFTDTDNLFDAKFNSDAFPKTNKGFQWTTTNVTADEISSFVYYLLHPTKGIAYVTTWFKNKISGVIVGWHEDVVGNTASNVTTGMTQYLGFNGYITVSSLADIEWTAWLLNIYNSLVIYLIIIMCVILTCYIIVGQLSFQRGFIGLVSFAILIFFPPVAINATVDTINRTADSIYSNKFDYWAIVQNQAYLGQLNLAVRAETTGEYISALLDMNSTNSADNALGGEYAQTFSGVRVKWMTPKRSNDTASLRANLEDMITSTSGLSSGLVSLASNIYSSVNTTESFVQSDNAKYLYRDYMDIYRTASVVSSLYDTNGYSFGGLSNNSDSPIRISTNTGQSVVGNTSWSGESSNKYLAYSDGTLIRDGVFTNIENSPTYGGLPEAIRGTSSINALKRGFLYPTTVSSSEVYYSQKTLASSLFLLNARPTIAIADKYKSFIDNYNGSFNISVAKLKSNSKNNVLFGISPDKFSMTLADYISASEQADEGLKSLNTEDWQYFIWGLYSESPFYYFNNNIRDQVKAANVGYAYDRRDLANRDAFAGHIKNLFLKDNQAYFFNMQNNAGDGYGELRDFMNMHDFFYYVMPCLQIGVNLTDAYDEVFGMYLYDDCSLTLDSTGSWVFDGEVFNTDSDLFNSDAVSKLDDEDLYKLWHDYNVYTIFNCYTTWLDTMNDCDYADPEVITVAGKRFTVSNPLDPMTYFNLDATGDMVEGRYMIFSRSEMAYYGLDWNDLTKVEQKIITVQDNVYKESIDLMNYYTLSDEVIIQAYAMLQLFEFNKEFSQTSFISKDYILYPQGYELKAFTYDAYLRLILTESSGEALMTNSADTENVSIYQRILQKTSIFFGIVLLVNDFLAVYVIPALRLFFIVAIFIMSVAMIVASAIKLNSDANRTLLSTTWHSLIAPLVSFGITTVVLAFIVSLFMSDGATGVVDNSVTISLGDPTMAVFVMCVINAICVIVYYRICKKCMKDLIGYVKAIGTSVGGAVIGAAAAISKSLTGSARRGRLLNTIKNAGSDDDSKSNASYDANKAGQQNNPASGSSPVRNLFGAMGVGYGAKKLLEAGSDNTSGSDGSSSAGVAGGTSGTKSKNYNQKAMDSSKVQREGADSSNSGMSKGESARLNSQRNREMARAKREENYKNKKDLANKDKLKFIDRKNAMMNKDNSKLTRVAAGAGMLSSGVRYASKSASAAKAGINASIGARTDLAVSKLYGIAKDTGTSIANTGHNIKKAYTNSNLNKSIIRAKGDVRKGLNGEYSRNSLDAHLNHTAWAIQRKRHNAELSRRISHNYNGTIKPQFS